MDYTNVEINKNLRKCPEWEKCSQNLCPLDLELSLRSGGREDKCRWMCKPRHLKYKNTPKTEGSIMPDELLKFVPKNNILCLNMTSQKRYQELMV